MKTALVAQNGKGGPTLAAALRRAASDGAFDRLDVAVACATLQGLKALERALKALPPVTRWVVGLDDAITQPEAIEYLLGLPGASAAARGACPRPTLPPQALLPLVLHAAAPMRCRDRIGQHDADAQRRQHLLKVPTKWRGSERGGASYMPSPTAGLHRSRLRVRYQGSHGIR